MKWPWSKQVEDAQQQAMEAAEGHAHSVQVRIDAEQERDKAMRNVRVLRHELDKNGFTELMYQAWGGRAR